MSPSVSYRFNFLFLFICLMFLYFLFIFAGYSAFTKFACLSRKGCSGALLLKPNAHSWNLKFFSNLWPFVCNAYIKQNGIYVTKRWICTGKKLIICEKISLMFLETNQINYRLFNAVCCTSQTYINFQKVDNVFDQGCTVWLIKLLYFTGNNRDFLCVNFTLIPAATLLNICELWCFTQLFFFLQIRINFLPRKMVIEGNKGKIIVFVIDFNALKQ